MGRLYAPSSATPPAGTGRLYAAPVQEAPKPGLFTKIKDAAKNRIAEAKKSLPGGEYASQQSGAESGLQVAGQAAGFVNDAAGEAIIAAGKTLLPKRAENAIERGTQKVVKKVASTAPVRKATALFGEIKEKDPALARDITAATNVISLLPVAKGAQLGAKGAGEATVLAGDVVTASGRAAQSTGRGLFRSAITPTVGEAERILKYEAKVPFLERAANTITGTKSPFEPRLRADTALEKGIFGRQKDVGVQAYREADKLWNETIAPAVKASDARVSKDELFAPILERINNTAEPGKKKAYQEAFAAIQDDYKNTVDFSIDEAQAVKRDLDKFTPEKVFRGKSVANEYNMLRNDMANAIRTKTYDALEDQNIRRAYLDYGNLTELEKIGVKAISDSGTRGGFGGFWTAMWDKATVPVKTVGGQVVYRVGNLLEFTGRKGIKTFGEFLKGRGFKPPKT